MQGISDKNSFMFEMFIMALECLKFEIPFLLLMEKVVPFYQGLDFLISYRFVLASLHVNNAKGCMLKLCGNSMTKRAHKNVQNVRLQNTQV